MLGFIERNFFVIVQRLGLLFAFIAFVAVIALGILSYEKISIKPSDKIKTPVVEFAKYQNPISVISKKDANINKNVKKSKNKEKFEKEFDGYIRKIIANLETLPDDVIDKDYLRSSFKTEVKIKSNTYTRDLKLAYASSLARLTKQVVNVGGSQVNVGDFLKWHDKEFAEQVDSQTQNNLLKMGTIKAQKATGFMMLGMTIVALGMFIMFVMMLAMLRIERNTRK